MTRAVLRVAEVLAADSERVRIETAKLPSWISAATAEVAIGTVLTLEARRRWWSPRPRVLTLARLARAMTAIEQATAVVTIVAGAVVRNHRVLSAQRDSPPSMAGKWEFPGGKVEAGESPRAALVRELAEELGIQVEVGPEIARQELETGAVLILFQAQLSSASPDPEAREHRDLRWLTASQLMEVDWLATNAIFITNLSAIL